MELTPPTTAIKLHSITFSSTRRFYIRLRPVTDGSSGSFLSLSRGGSTLQNQNSPQESMMMKAELPAQEPVLPSEQEGGGASRMLRIDLKCVKFLTRTISLV